MSDALPQTNSDANSQKPPVPISHPVTVNELPTEVPDNQLIREHYIPVRKSDLVEMLPAYVNAPPKVREEFERVCALMDSLLHFGYHERTNRMAKVYGHLDPDMAVVETSEITSELRDTLSDSFFEELEIVLTGANYRRLQRKDIETSVQMASQLGMHLEVDFDVFENLHIYARGNDTEQWTKQNWLTLYRKQEIEVDIFRRLILAFRLKDHEGLGEKESPNVIYIKTFKNIPHSDLDVLLPGTTVKMTLLDRGKIIVPSLSSVALNIFKAWRGVMLLTAFASVFALFSWLGLLIAAIVYVVKIFMGLNDTEDKYRLNLTQHLYFQNLDNNSGAMYRILSEAEDQDFREAAVAYFFLWQNESTGLTDEELDSEAEKFLNETLKLSVDFEISDAVRKLEELKIAEKQSDGKWSVLPPEKALKVMDKTWDEIYQYNKPSKISELVWRF